MAWRRWHPDLWTLDHPFVAGGLHLGIRATAVRDEEGVALISAVPMSEADRAELAQLGPVTAIVAPNLLHWMYAGAALASHPQARLYGPGALEKKAPDLPWSPLDLAAPRWRGLHAAPLEGLPKMTETTFFHAPSRTLIATDLAFNVVSSDSWWTRSFMRLNNAYGRFGPSRIFRSMLKDPPALRRSLDALIALEPERIVISHGSVLEQGGTETLREAYAWVR